MKIVMKFKVWGSWCSCWAVDLDRSYNTNHISLGIPSMMRMMMLMTMMFMMVMMRTMMMIIMMTVVMMWKPNKWSQPGRCLACFSTVILSVWNNIDFAWDAADVDDHVDDVDNNKDDPHLKCSPLFSLKGWESTDRQFNLFRECHLIIFIITDIVPVASEYQDKFEYWQC